MTELKSIKRLLHAESRDFGRNLELNQMGKESFNALAIIHSAKDCYQKQPFIATSSMELTTCALPFRPTRFYDRSSAIPDSKLLFSIEFKSFRQSDRQHRSNFFIFNRLEIKFAPKSKLDFHLVESPCVPGRAMRP